MKTYFNIKTPGSGVETIDEINSKDFKSVKEYRAEKKSMIKNYNLLKMGVYLSPKCTREWGN